MTPDEIAARDSIANRLAVLMLGASLDELRVAERVLVRFLGTGPEQYGRMRIATDRRDFDSETGDELADALVYVAVEWLRREDRKLAPLREAAAREIAMPCDCWNVPERHLEITGHLAECKAAHRRPRKCECEARMAGECMCGAWDEER